MHGDNHRSFGWRSLFCLLIPLTLTQAAPGQEFTITSADGQLQVVLPSEWEQVDLHVPGGQIQAASSLKQLYLVVSGTERVDAVGTLEDYARSDIQSAAHRLDEVSISGPHRFVAGGRRCIQYQVHAILPKAQLRVAYLLTFKQTEHHFLKIASWTAESHFESNMAQLSRVAENVSETNRVEATKDSTRVGTNRNSTRVEASPNSHWTVSN